MSNIILTTFSINLNSFYTISQQYQLMKVSAKQINTIPFRKANTVNPEINQAPNNIKPLVIKHDQYQTNASMMAAIEQKKTQAIKRAQQQKIRSFQQNIKMNASRISEEKSILSINLKKQKQDAFQKQKQIKQQYTKIYSKTKNNEDTMKHVLVKPEAIQQNQDYEQQIEIPIRKQPSVKLMRERSKSPLSPLGINKSQIAIPKFIDDNGSSSQSDYRDSEDQGENVQEVMNNYMKIRRVMQRKLK